MPLPPAVEINPKTSLPHFHDLTGMTIVRVQEERRGSEPACVALDVDNQILAGMDLDFDDDGPPGFFHTQGLTAAQCVGKKIVSTGIIVWRASRLDVVPRIDPAPPYLFQGPHKIRSEEERACAGRSRAAASSTVRDSRPRGHETHWVRRDDSRGRRLGLCMARFPIQG